MDLKTLEIEARELALRDVKNMLQRPGQLEKVDQYRNRARRKKAAVEQRLKTAMQNQLDGARVGLKQLESCLADIKETDTRLGDIDQLLKAVPGIYDVLEQVRNENAKHSQYATAIENLKHIFTVQASVQKTEQWIEEDKLLHAHQCLSDLENSRDDLLFELHKLPNQSAHDKITLKRYFEKVDVVSKKLENKLRIILNRTLNTVRKEPTVIVTTFRIIEREEKSDAFALAQKKQTGFIPPNRPKQWRKMAMGVLNQMVVERIESSKLDEREDNKLWLVRNLEIVRQFILEDLKVVKLLCVPCLPPSYNIFSEYVTMYHNALSKSMEEIIDAGLEGNEYVAMLSWSLNTYPGADLMSNPDLNVDASLVQNLIKPEQLKQMESEYLNTMQKNYDDWLNNALEKEKSSWTTGAMPEEEDNEKYYHTSAPVIIFQMIDQHLQVTNTIHAETTYNALVMSIRQVTRYGENYRQGIGAFREMYFRDRSQIPFFTQHIITAMNNCQQMIDLAQQMMQLYWPKSRSDNYEEFEKLLKTYQELRKTTAEVLLDEAFLDLEVHFRELFTPPWLTSKQAVDTICVTLADYFSDYSHLRLVNFEYVLMRAQKMVVTRYLRAMLSKKMRVTDAEIDGLVKRITEDANQMQSLFERVNRKPTTKVDSPIQIIPSLATLLSSNLDALSLDFISLFANYPSITEDHLVRLLHLRKEINDTRTVKEKVQSAMEWRKPRVGNDLHEDIFKELVFTDKLW